MSEDYTPPKYIGLSPCSKCKSHTHKWQSTRTGSFYRTNSENRSDFHKCVPKTKKQESQEKPMTAYETMLKEYHELKRKIKSLEIEMKQCPFLESACIQERCQLWHQKKENCAFRAE